MNNILLMVFLVLPAVTIPWTAAAQVNLSFDGTQVNLTASNETYGNILDLLGRHTGIRMEIPKELKAKRVTILEVRRLGIKAAIVKIMEGSGYDYFVLARPGHPHILAGLIVAGKSKTSKELVRHRRPRSQNSRKPFVGRNMTSFGRDSGSGSGASTKRQTVKPVVQPKAPKTAQTAAPFPVRQPYGQTLGGRPPIINQNPPTQAGQVQSPQVRGGQMFGRHGSAQGDTGRNCRDVGQRNRPSAIRRAVGVRSGGMRYDRPAGGGQAEGR